MSPISQVLLVLGVSKDLPYHHPHLTGEETEDRFLNSIALLSEAEAAGGLSMLFSPLGEAGSFGLGFSPLLGPQALPLSSSVK